MKNIVLVLFVILLSGCVAERQGQPVVETKNVLSCPEIVEKAAKNLEQMDLNPDTIQVWKKIVLDKKIQPCNACQKLNAAAFILNDENNIYKPAMVQFIKSASEEDPNKAPTPVKPYIGGSTTDQKEMEQYALAQQYMSALEELQTFLGAEIKIPFIDAENFVLDNYFIPLLEEAAMIQDPNQNQ